MSDPGQYLTDSGSKIPVPRSAINVPQKPNLSAAGVKKINYTDSTSAAAKKTVPSQQLVRSKPGIGRSIPNVSKPKPVVRSKTNLNKPASTVKATPAAVKRPASVDDLSEASLAKIPKTGFPYKSKNWELKNRLAECEDWLTEARNEITELTDERDRNKEELASISELKIKAQLEAERAKDLEKRLIETTSAYDKLTYDSKTFLEKIQSIEQDNTIKTEEIVGLRAKLSKSEDELRTKTTDLTNVQSSLDELERNFRRQKNNLEDTEKELDEKKQEIKNLQKSIGELRSQLEETQDKLDRCERDIRRKDTNISDLEQQVTEYKAKVAELNRSLAETKENNSGLSCDLSLLRDSLAGEKLKLSEMSKNHEEMRTKLIDAEKMRRVLHNQVQDLKGNIRVFCRVRPPLPTEKENCLMCSINYPDEGSIEISKADPFVQSNIAVTSRPKFQKNEFSFDRVFNPSASQALIFEELSQLVQSALDGYNVCIFAYGQTGSGKTHTMEGQKNPEGRGMIPRTVQHIFDTVADLERIGWEYTVEVCFIEIYNEVIRDLLRTDAGGNNLKIMNVDSRTNDVVIPDLTVMKVNSFEDLDRFYVLAHQNRAVASTSFNERSSRSHSVTKIKVTGVNKERGETCYGSLNLVDLAGSERLSEATHSNDSRLREMKSINKSLTELGNVILGLYQKNEHIPYRNSKLTHLLQPALGGSSKTLMLVNISPVESCMSETLCSLRFAQKVNQVKVASSKKRITYDAAAAVPK